MLHRKDVLTWSKEELAMCSHYGKMYVVASVGGGWINLFRLRRKKGNYHVDKKEERSIHDMEFGDGGRARKGDVLFITKDNMVDLFLRENFQYVD